MVSSAAIVASSAVRQIAQQRGQGDEAGGGRHRDRAGVQQPVRDVDVDHGDHDGHRNRVQRKLVRPQRGDQQKAGGAGHFHQAGHHPCDVDRTRIAPQQHQAAERGGRHQQARADQQQRAAAVADPDHVGDGKTQIEQRTKQEGHAQLRPGHGQVMAQERLLGPGIAILATQGRHFRLLRWGRS
jgi:hypothetical protein